MALRNIIKTFFIAWMFSISFSQSTFSYSLHSRVWGSAEYLHWWTQNSPIRVPLATSNPFTMASINSPGTQIIIGAGSHKNTFNFGETSGARITIGGWVDDAYQYGIEASGFGLSRTKKTFSASSVGGNISNLDVPFFSTQSPTGETVLVNGRPNTITDSDTLQPSSIELNGLYHMTNYPLVLSVGFRYMNINEKVRLNDAIYNNGPFLPPNAVLNVRDHFSTKNNFYGLQIGAHMNYTYCNLNFEIVGEIALGRNYQTLSINGQTNVDDKTILQPIGLFAEPTNIGTFKNNELAIIPELQIKMDYDFNQCIRAFVTYNFIYINHIIRPGNEIDRNINKSQNALLGGSGILSGPAAPLPRFNQTSMWMQGISVGVEFSWA